MRHLIVYAFSTIVFLTPGSVMAADGSLSDKIAGDYPYLAELFEHFHRNPELSFLEHKTAERLGAELQALGFDVTHGVGGTGLVAILENGAGPTVMIRADMDGLPVVEATGLVYGSTARQVDITGEEVGVMHACGHDMQMTTMVGTARRMVAAKDSWRGRLMLVGQPAEERIGGAKAMVEDGIYERFGRPDYALALHVSAGETAGQIIYKPGLSFSSSDSVNILVRGVGTHGASPHMGKDPVLIASQIVVALQTLVAREISPLEPGVVTVGAFHAGTKHNIISDHAELQITVRANSEDTRHKLLQGIKRIAENAGRMAGLPENLLPVVDLSVEAAPTTYNDEALTARVDGVFRQHFGDDQIATLVQRGMGAEDFPYFTMVEPPIPGLYFNIGGTPQADLDAAQAGGPPVAGHHSPLFKIAPEPSIKAGVEAMTVAALELLAKP